jgi:hypothetical protein
MDTANSPTMVMVSAKSLIESFPRDQNRPFCSRTPTVRELVSWGKEHVSHLIWLVMRTIMISFTDAMGTVAQDGGSDDLYISNSPTIITAVLTHGGGK